MKNVPHIFYIEPGGHDFKVWKNDLYMFSQLLFKPVNPESFSAFTVLGSPASTNVRSAKYPQILPDNRVIFKVKAPDAQRVQIDLVKKYDMTKDAEGFWSVTTDTVSEGIHYYSLIIDGVALADPSSETFYGMGRMAAGIEHECDVTIQPCSINGDGSTFTRLQNMIATQLKNIRCCIFCTEEEKMSAAGQLKERPILFWIILLPMEMQSRC